ncbi:MAG: hypothetical protein OSJ24_04205 [Muribaculaceae bacterium]|nr:hypothetical protein [Muribaculaceae bacterium]
MEHTEAQEPSLEQQLAEAEERGYRRGLNEQIESRMNEPGTWEGTAPAATPTPGPTPEAFRILGATRRSIWDC